jgi:hypothetical protein
MTDAADQSASYEGAERFGEGYWFNGEPSPELDKEVLDRDEVTARIVRDGNLRKKLYVVERSDIERPTYGNRKPLEKLLCSSANQAKIALDMPLGDLDKWALHMGVKMPKSVKLTFANGTISYPRTVTCQGQYFWGLSDEHGSWVTSLSKMGQRPIELIRLRNEEEMLLVFEALEKPLSSVDYIRTNDLYALALKKLEAHRIKRGVDYSLPKSLVSPSEPSRVIYSQDSDFARELEEARKARETLRNDARGSDELEALNKKREYLFHVLNSDLASVDAGLNPFDVGDHDMVQEAVPDVDDDLHAGLEEFGALDDDLDMQADLEHMQEENDAMQAFEDEDVEDYAGDEEEVGEEFDHATEEDAGVEDPEEPAPQEEDYDGFDAAEDEEHGQERADAESHDTGNGDETDPAADVEDGEQETQEEATMPETPETSIDPSEITSRYPGRNVPGSRAFSSEKSAFSISAANHHRLAVIPPWWDGELLQRAVDEANASGTFRFADANGYYSGKDADIMFRPATSRGGNLAPLFIADDAEVDNISSPSRGRLTELAPVLSIVIGFFMANGRDFSPASGPAYLVFGDDGDIEAISEYEVDESFWIENDARYGVRLDLDDGSWNAWFGFDDRGDVVMVGLHARSRRVRLTPRSVGRDVFGMLAEVVNEMDSSGPSVSGAKSVLGDVNAVAGKRTDLSDAVALAVTMHSFFGDYPNWNYRDGEDAWISSSEFVRKAKYDHVEELESVATKAEEITASVYHPDEVYAGDNLGAFATLVRYCVLRSHAWRFLVGLGEGGVAEAVDASRSAEMTASMEERDGVEIIGYFVPGTGGSEADTDTDEDARYGSDAAAEIIDQADAGESGGAYEPEDELDDAPVGEEVEIASDGESEDAPVSGDEASDFVGDDSLDSEAEDEPADEGEATAEDVSDPETNEEASNDGNEDDPAGDPEEEVEETATTDASEEEESDVDFPDYRANLYGEAENFVEDWATRNDDPHPDDLYIGFEQEAVVDEEQQDEPQADIASGLSALLSGNEMKTAKDYDFAIDLATALATAAEAFSQELLRSRKMRFGEEGL